MNFDQLKSDFINTLHVKGGLDNVSPAQAKQVNAAFQQYAIEAFYQDLNKKAKVEATHLAKVVRAVNRHDAHVAQVTSFMTELLISGIKTIPAIGGFAGLVHKMINNPLSGTWQVVRCGFGNERFGTDGFNLFGDAKNNVWSPLTYNTSNPDGAYGLSGMNLSTGNATLFQSDQRKRFEQFESELANLISPVISDKLGIKNIHGAFKKTPIELKQQPHFNAGDYTTDASVRVYLAYQRRPKYFFFRALSSIILVDINDHDGIKDILSGSFLNDEGIIVDRDELKKRVSTLGKTYISKHSPVYHILYKSSDTIQAVYKQCLAEKGRLQISDKQAINSIITPVRLSETLLVKVKYLSYWEPLVGHRFFSSALDTLVKSMIEKHYRFSMSLTMSNIGQRLAICLAFCEELLLSYLGTTKMSLLPPTALYLDAVSYVIDDCAASAADLMHKNNNTERQKWRDWFYLFLLKLPEVNVFFDRCQQQGLLNQHKTFSGKQVVGLSPLVNPNLLGVEFSPYPRKTLTFDGIGQHESEIKQYLAPIVVPASDKLKRPSWEKYAAAHDRVYKPIEIDGKSSIPLWEDIVLSVDKKEHYIESVQNPWARYKTFYDLIQYSGEINLDELKLLIKGQHEVIKAILCHTGMRKEVMSKKNK